MRLKTTEINGAVYAEVQDGKPVYEAEDGKAIAFDAPATIDTINKRGAEARDRRIEKEQAEARLKLFEGLDPEKARQAIEMVANLDAKKLVEAGEVDKVRSAAKSEFDRQVEAIRNEFKPHLEERDSLRHQLEHERLSTAFGQSKFIAAKVDTPMSLVRSEFGRHFFTEDGKLRAKGQDGNLVYSRANPGNPADFDEAIELLIDAHPDRDRILKGTGASGGGANGSRTGADGKRTITRAALEALPPMQQAAAARESTIVD